MNGCQVVQGAPGRVTTGISALDCVLGGGLIEGSTILFAGCPCTGKTTLTLQMLAGLGQRCLYVTDEEALEHVKASTRRSGSESNQICMLADTRLGEILERARSMRAQMIAIDTIQTLVCEHVDVPPGRPAQLRSCMKHLTDYQMTTDTTLWLISQLTRRGELAGSVTGVHHFADVVLRLDQEDDARILSSSKNRFGSVHDGALFKLTAKGFVEYAAS